MDKASDYESGDSSFESWRGRFLRVKNKSGPKVKVDQTTEMYFYCLIRLYRKVAIHENL